MLNPSLLSILLKKKNMATGTLTHASQRTKITTLTKKIPEKSFNNFKSSVHEVVSRGIDMALFNIFL